MSNKTRPCLICEHPTDKFYRIGHQIFYKCEDCEQLQRAVHQRPKDLPMRTDNTQHQSVVCFQPGRGFDAEAMAKALRDHPAIAASDMLTLAAELIRNCHSFEDYPDLEKVLTELEFVSISEQKAVRDDSDRTPDKTDCY